MGEVWKARDTRVDRIVAIKRLKAEHAERFKREARAIAALNHPRICQLYDVGPDYLVMEYVEGEPLKGPLPVADAQRLAVQIAEALEQFPLGRSGNSAGIAQISAIFREIGTTTNPKPL